MHGKGESLEGLRSATADRRGGCLAVQGGEIDDQDVRRAVAGGGFVVTS